MALLTEAYRADKSDAVEQRRRDETWQALNLFVQQRSGWVVSPPGRQVRIECARGSGLPSQLAKLGFRIGSVGTTMRNGGPTGFMPVDVFEFRIDGR